MLFSKLTYARRISYTCFYGSCDPALKSKPLNVTIFVSFFDSAEDHGGDKHHDRVESRALAGRVRHHVHPTVHDDLAEGTLRTVHGPPPASQHDGRGGWSRRRMGSAWWPTRMTLFVHLRTKASWGALGCELYRACTALGVLDLSFWTARELPESCPRTAPNSFFIDSYSEGSPWTDLAQLFGQTKMTDRSLLTTRGRK